jgi:hypothetical protein
MAVCKYEHVELVLLCGRTKFKYRVAPKSVNLRHSLVFAGIFRFKPAGQFVEHHSIVSCTLNMEDLISKNFYKFSK